MRNFDKTWIKLPRSFTSWRWYHESKMVHLFLYLLLQANVKKKDYLSLTIYPGQVVTSLVQIAQDTGLSIRNVRTCLKKLSSTKDIKARAATREQLFPFVILNVSCSFLMKMILWAGLNSTAKSCLGSGIKMGKRFIFSSICC